MCFPNDPSIAIEEIGGFAWCGYITLREGTGSRGSVVDVSLPPWRDRGCPSVENDSAAYNTNGDRHIVQLDVVED